MQQLTGQEEEVQVDDATFDGDAAMHFIITHFHAISDWHKPHRGGRRRRGGHAIASLLILHLRSRKEVLLRVSLLSLCGFMVNGLFSFLQVTAPILIDA